MFFLLFPTPFYLAYGTLFIKAEAESEDPNKDESDPVLLFINQEDKAGSDWVQQSEPSGEPSASSRLAYASGVELGQGSTAALKAQEEEGGR